MLKRWNDILNDNREVRRSFNPNMYKSQDGDTFEVLHVAHMNDQELVIYRNLDIYSLGKVLAMPITEFKNTFEQIYKD